MTVPDPLRPWTVRLLPVPDRIPSIVPLPLAAVKSFWTVVIPTAEIMIRTVVTPTGAKATVLSVVFSEGVQSSLAVMPPVDSPCTPLVPQLTTIANVSIMIILYSSCKFRVIMSCLPFYHPTAMEPVFVAVKSLPVTFAPFTVTARLAVVKAYPVLVGVTV
jgi:hypothetical protein